MNKKRCMVLMPFKGDQINQHYFDVVKPAVEKSGKYDCFRVDEIEDASYKITKEIITGIETSDIIIANITGNNANVFYELGMAHSFGTNVLVICDKQETNIPFDIKEYRVFLYENSEAGNRKLDKYINNNLLNLKWMKKKNNPIYDNSERIRYLLDFCPPVKSPSDNIPAIEEVYDDVMTLRRNKSLPQNGVVEHVICVTGPVAIGKTTFSKGLAEYMNQREGEGTAQVLTLDGYMKDRRILMTSNTPNGYDDANWDFGRAEEDLRELLFANKSIFIREYNHKTGRHKRSKVEVKASKYLIIDGLISFHRIFEHYCDQKIFICGNNLRNEQNPRIQVAYHERGYSLKDAIDKSEREIKDYKSYLLPEKEKADIWLIMEGGSWNYRLVYDYPGSK
ncbi:MAG: hypothetical protein AB2598_17125 [Candidatus Thiodiazotropha sp.]